MERDVIAAVPGVYVRVRDPRRERNRRRAAVNSHHVNQYLLRREVKHIHHGQSTSRQNHQIPARKPGPDIKKLTTEFYENGGFVKSTEAAHKKMVQAHKRSIRSQRMLLITQIELSHWLEMKIAKEKQVEDFEAVKEKRVLEKSRDEFEEHIQKRRREERDQILQLQEEIERMQHQRSSERAEIRKEEVEARNEEIRTDACREVDYLIQLCKVIEQCKSEKQHELDEKLRRTQIELERLLKERTVHEEEDKNAIQRWEMAMEDWELREENRKKQNMYLEEEFRCRVEDDLHDSGLDQHQISRLSKHNQDWRTIGKSAFIPKVRHSASSNPPLASSQDSTPVQKVCQETVYIYIGYQEHGEFIYRHNHPWRHRIGGHDKDINLIKKINKEYAKLKPFNWFSIQSIGFARYIRWDKHGVDKNLNPIWVPAEQRGIIHFEDGRSVELFEHFHKIPEDLGSARKWINNLEDFVRDANDKKGTKCWIMIEICEVPNFWKCFVWLCIALVISIIAGVVYRVETGDTATAISLASYIGACEALLLGFIAAGQYMGYAKPEEDAFTYKLGPPSNTYLGWDLPRIDPTEIFSDN